MPVETSVGAVVIHDGHLLLIQRGRGVAVGRWSLPGGRVEFGETLAQAVAREVAEETGLTVTVGEFLGWVERMGADPPFHYVILDFAATPAGPDLDPVAADDATAAVWVPLEEVGGYDLVAGLEAFLRQVGVLDAANTAKMDGKDRVAGS